MVTTVTAVTIEIIQKWIEAVAILILTFWCEGGREVAAEDEQGRFGHFTGFTVSNRVQFCSFLARCSAQLNQGLTVASNSFSDRGPIKMIFHCQFWFCLILHRTQRSIHPSNLLKYKELRCYIRLWHVILKKVCPCRFLDRASVSAPNATCAPPWIQTFVGCLVFLHTEVGISQLMF